MGGKKANQRQGRRAAKQASPPAGYHSDKAGRRPPPLRPPPGTQTAGIASDAGVQPRGRREPPAYPPIPPFFAPPLDKTQAYVYNVA